MPSPAATFKRKSTQASLPMPVDAKSRFGGLGALGSPPEMTNAPPEMTNAPPEMTNRPPEMTNAPPEMTLSWRI